MGPADGIGLDGFDVNDPLSIEIAQLEEAKEYAWRVNDARAAEFYARKEYNARVHRQSLMHALSREEFRMAYEDVPV